MQKYKTFDQLFEALYAHFPFETAKHTTDEKGLLDSGAMHNFIDVRTAICLGVGTQKLKTPRTVTNVDGTTNRAGTILKYSNLECTDQRRQKKLPFYITK